MRLGCVLGFRLGRVSGWGHVLHCSSLSVTSSRGLWEASYMCDVVTLSF